MSPSPEEIRRQIQSLAFGQGFCACGIAPAEPLPEDARAIARWVEQGRNASLEYMARHADKREDIRRMVPGARSIICLAHSYLTDTSETVSRQTGVAKYALGEDYHTVLKDKMHRLCTELKKTAGEFSYRVFTDSAPVAERRLAQRAGLGWIGKSTQLILPKVGSYVFLSEIVTDLALPPDEPFPGSRCGACRRCQMACPTGAIDGQGTIDARKCLSYATIESRDDLPEDLAEKLGGRVFGCDACLDACPWNRHAERTGDPRLQPLSALASLQKSQWLTLDEATFRQVFTASPLRRAGWEKIRKTAEKALKK